MSLEPLALVLYVASIMILWRVVESRGGEDGGTTSARTVVAPVGGAAAGPQSAAGRAWVLG